MEDVTWKKDTTLYVVFICGRCHQYLYVKTTQKTKKCLRCRRTYQVRLIQNKGEIIHGISNVVKRVKKLENTLGVSQFTTKTEFSIYSEDKAKKDLSQVSNQHEWLFLDLLKTLSLKYREFPVYMIELMAQDYNIPPRELKILIRNFLKEKKLILNDEKTNRYSVKLNP